MHLPFRNVITYAGLSADIWQKQKNFSTRVLDFNLWKIIFAKWKLYYTSVKSTQDFVGKFAKWLTLGTSSRVILPSHVTHRTDKNGTMTVRSDTACLCLILVVVLSCIGESVAQTKQLIWGQQRSLGIRLFSRTSAFISCIWGIKSSSAGVYSIFYYPSSIGSRGQGAAGTARPDPWHVTSWSMARHILIHGTSHPDLWHVTSWSMARPDLWGGNLRSEGLKLNLGTRYWM